MQPVRVVRWVAISVGAGLLVLAIIAGATSRTETLRRLVVETVADQLDSDIELASFSVDTFPAVNVRGEGLVVRLRGAGDVPPIIKIKSFDVEGGMFGLLSRPRRFKRITLDGLEINIPPDRSSLKKPKEPRDAQPATGGEGTSAGAAASPPARDSAGKPEKPPFHIDLLESTDAVLRLIPRDPAKTPREFGIHELRMTDVGLERRMPFQAEVTNPVPRGQVTTEGHFGPWNVKPGDTPLDGKYVFADADLSTIKGIAGILSSTGEFSGQLGRIEVNGQTETPDFRLDYADQPVPLSTTFQAVIDGTNGNTYLNEVNARLKNTAFVAKGAVTGIPGVKGRSVEVQMTMADGRIEDLLALTVKSKVPALTGRIAVKSDLAIPPGPADVIERMKLAGQFDLSSAKFTGSAVQEKLAGMSARASGKDPDEAPATVMSDLEGRFRMAGGAISFPDLRFRIPGAGVRLAGSYGLRSEALEFDGTLRMDATISEAAGGGMKSIFLKIVDPFFKKKGAGAVLPIRIRGTRADPKFGLDVGKALTPR